MSTTVYLGNHNAVQVSRDPEDQLVRTPVEGKRCTVFVPPHDWGIPEIVQTLAGPTGTWTWHSDDEKPAWVASTDPALAQVLSAYWGCELREPDPAVI